MRLLPALLSCVSLVPLLACTHAPSSKRNLVAAVASLQSRSGSALQGKADFSVDGAWVSFHLSVEGVSPGTHAVHLHQNPDCTAPDGSSAGPHWNPSSEGHGAFGHAPFHLGDVGNLEVGPDGKGQLSFKTDRWSVGSGQPNDVLGRSVVVHASPDDFQTQPTGNAGGRIGCGAVVPASP